MNPQLLGLTQLWYWIFTRLPSLQQIMSPLITEIELMESVVWATRDSSVSVLERSRDEPINNKMR